MSDGNGQGRDGKPGAAGPGSAGFDDSWFIDAQKRAAADPPEPAARTDDDVAPPPPTQPAAPAPNAAAPSADAGVDIDESLMRDEDVTSGVATLHPIARPPATPAATALPALVLPAAPVDASPSEFERAKATVEHCEREAKAYGKIAAAAPLWFEAGRLYEHVLRNPRQAASCYQAAFTADGGYVPVIHAARRLFADIGNWAMVVHLITAETRVVTDGARRAALLVQRGAILQNKLAKEAEAEASYREALEAAPEYGPAFEALTRRVLAQQRYNEFIELSRKVIDRLPAGEQRDQRTLTAARVLEAQLDEPERALELVGRVLQSNPAHRIAAVVRVRILTRLKHDPELVEALEHLARIETGERRAAALVEAARICRSRLHDSDRARALLERAKVAAPANMLVLRDLGDVLAVGEHHAELADVLLEQAAHITDYRERVAVHAELGRLFEEKLHSEEKAIEQYQKVIEFDSTYQPALASLGRLYYRHNRFQDLVRLYEEEIAQIEDEAHKVPRLFKVAELLQNQIGNVDKALAYYQAVLAIDPRYIPAQKALGALLLAAGRWSDLIQIYEHELALTQDRDQRIFLLDKIGTLWDEKLNDVDRAIDAFERMLAIASGYLPAIRNLGKLYARAKRFREMIRVSEQEAQALQDPMQVVALLYRTGEIYEVNLGDKDKAIEVYRKVIGLNPTYLPALKSLGRLYHERGLFDDLIDMHRQEAEVCRDAGQRAALLFKIGEVYEEKLHDQDAAIRSYRDVLREVPNHHPALRALGRIWLTRGDDAGLAEVAKLECAVLNNPRERAIARCRAALVEEIHLGQDQAARQSYQSALDDNPALVPAQAALARIAQRNKDPDAEVAALHFIVQQAANEADQVALGLQLADRLAFGANRLSEALAAYQGVLARAPNEVPALRGALHCALGQHDYRQAIAFGEQLAALEPEASAAASLHLQIASWRSAHLDPPEDPTTNYLKALEYTPADPIALRAVEAAYTKAGFHVGLFALYQRERETVDNPAHLQFLTLRMAELALGPLQRSELGLALLEDAVSTDPKSTIALRMLKQGYATTDRITDQLRVLALEADASPDPQAAITNLLEVGRLQEERANNQGAAADCYLKVLRRQPDHGEAFARAERLLSMLERFGDLALLYHGRADVVTDIEPKLGLLMRAAQLEVNQLSNPIAALATFREVLKLNLRYVPALIGAGDIELTLEHYAEAAELYSQVVVATQDPTVVAPIFRRLGDIYRVRLPDPPRAIQAYVSSLAAQHNNIEVLGRLGDLYVEQEAWAEASEVLAKRLTFVTDREQRLDTLYKLAQIFETGLGNPMQAAHFLEQAVAIDPASPATFERLAALYQRTSNWPALAATLSRLATSLPSDQQRNALPILRDLGALYEQKLNQPERAIEAYNAALGLDPADTAARTRVAVLLAANPATQTRAVDEYRNLLWHAPVDIPSYQALRQIFAAEKTRDREFVACELLHLIRATDEAESFFYDDTKNKVPVQTDYALTPDEHDALVIHPDARNVVTQVLRLCSAELSKVFPANLEAYQVSRSERLGPKSDDSLRLLADHLAKVLSGGHFDLYRCRAKPMALAVENTEPPSLIIGPEIVRRHPNREQRFLVGQLVETVISGHHLLAGMDAVKLATFLSAVGLAIDPTFAPFAPAGDTADLAKRIGKALSRAAKKALSELVPTLNAERGTIDLNRYLLAAPLTRVRAGMALANDFEAALRLTAREYGVNYNLNEPATLAAAAAAVPAIRELFAFALSEEYFTLRKKLHFAVDA